MIHRHYLRTIDLARAGAISVQQVRNYEASGFLPPSQRSQKGYRLYTAQHLAALTTTRSMVHGYGWQRTLQIMQAVHQNDLPTALALVDMRHAELASKRLQVEQTLKALQALTKESITWQNIHQTRALRIGEAAKQVGVRTSALHFWEQQGLLHPARDRSSKYRIYDDIQMHRLQLIVLLRDARYDFDTIRSVLEEMTSGRPEKAIQAVEKRNKELARTSWACIEAMSSLQSYIHDYCPEISSSFSIPKKE